MTKGNEAAFSKSAFYHESYGEDNPQKGLTKREYFAAMAMTALISEESNPLHYKDRAMEAVQMADALIEQLNNKQQ